VWRSSFLAAFKFFFHLNVGTGGGELGEVMKKMREVEREGSEETWVFKHRI
jgi:hypothetical protein